MKKILLIFLLAPHFIFSQFAIVQYIKLPEVAIDSIDLIKSCNCEKSIVPYKEDGKVYHVFMDLDTNITFRIVREKWYFRKEEIICQLYVNDIDKFNLITYLCKKIIHRIYQVTTMDTLNT